LSWIQEQHLKVTVDSIDLLDTCTADRDVYEREKESNRQRGKLEKKEKTWVDVL